MRPHALAQGAALLVLAVGLGCGPSPASVCAHTLELAKAELDGEALRGITEESCVERVERQRGRMGVSTYRAQASCVLAAADLGALSSCDVEVLEAAED